MLQTLSSRPYFADIAYSTSILEMLYLRLVLLNTLVPVWCQNHISIPELVLCLTVSSWLEITVIRIIWSVGTFVSYIIALRSVTSLNSVSTDRPFFHAFTLLKKFRPFKNTQVCVYFQCAHQFCYSLIVYS